MANTTPIFILTPNSVPTFSAAANLASDGSGTLIPLLTGSTNGTRIEQVVFRNAQLTQAASSAMLGKVFLSNTGNTSSQIVGEVLLAATTRSATVIGANGTITFSPALFIAPGQVLYATQSIYAGAQDRLSITAYASNY